MSGFAQIEDYSLPVQESGGMGKTMPRIEVDSESVSMKDLVRGSLSDGWADQVAALISRKVGGVDCTEEESAWIKSYFDYFHPEWTDEGARLAGFYPVELAEWIEEVQENRRWLHGQK